MSAVDVATVAYTLACMRDLHTDHHHRKLAQQQQSRDNPVIHLKPEYRNDASQCAEYPASFWENRDNWPYYRIKEAIALVKIHGARQQDVESQPQFRQFIHVFRKYLKESDNPLSVFYM